MYDIIGDIHGHADKLVALLSKLGYRDRAGAWRHPDPNRQAILVGDLIDRGPGQLATIGIVRRMIDAGSALAIMGNHEFNAIAYHTPDALEPGEYLRRRTDKNRRQHAAFLEEAEHDPALHCDLVTWFMTLPLWIDLPGIRVVHACWDESHADVLRSRLAPAQTMTWETLQAASRHETPEFAAVETLLKGPEVDLPKGAHYVDQGGHRRDRIRVRWWDDRAATYRQITAADEGTIQGIPDVPIDPTLRRRYPIDKPVFFGHYWMEGEPAPLTPRLACVDYSACNGGPLVAYCWDGESELTKANFVTAGT